MTTILYLLIVALVFFVIGYLWVKTGCTSGERYLDETPMDSVTTDDGSCEDEEMLTVQKEAREAEGIKKAKAARLAEETAVVEAKEAARREAEEKAHKEAEGKTAAETQARDEVEKATKEAESVEEAESIEEAVSEKKRKSMEGKGTDETEPKDTDTVEPTSVAPEGLLDAPIDSKKDNLTKIKGIGVKIDEALNGIGIYHFYQIAAWTEENMAWADGALAFPGRAKRDDWVGQAKALAEGKETEFSKRVEKGEVASSKKA